MSATPIEEAIQALNGYITLISQQRASDNDEGDYMARKYNQQITHVQSVIKKLRELPK